MKGRLVLPAQGLGELLAKLLGPPTAGPVSWRILLYSNPVDPTYATVLGDLTQCTFPGYEDYELDPALWQTPAVPAPGVVQSQFGTGPMVWSNGGSDTPVAGFGITRWIAGVNLLAVYEFPTLQTVPAGGTISILPRWSLTTDTCTPI